jgi:hypothetical protein
MTEQISIDYFGMALLIVCAIVLIVLAISAYGVKRAIDQSAKQARSDAQEAKNAAIKAAIATLEVKQSLEITTKGADIKLDSIHILVNNNMAIQLRLNMELSKWKAEQTKAPEDIEAAKLAIKMYEEHMAKQGIVNQIEAARS